MLSAHSCGAFRTMEDSRGSMLGEDGGIFGSVKSQPKPSHLTLTRVHLIPPLQLEIRTFIL